MKLKESTINLIAYAIIVIVAIYGLYQKKLEKQQLKSHDQGLIYQEISAPISLATSLGLLEDGAILEIS